MQVPLRQGCVPSETYSRVGRDQEISINLSLRLPVAGSFSSLRPSGRWFTGPFLRKRPISHSLKSACNFRSAASLCGPSLEQGTSQTTGPASGCVGTACRNQTPAGRGHLASPSPLGAGQPRPGEPRPSPRPAPGSRRACLRPGAA